MKESIARKVYSVHIMYVVTLNTTDQTATIMRKQLMPAKPSFFGEGNGIKRFFSPGQLSGHLCGSSHLFNPVVKFFFTNLM